MKTETALADLSVEQQRLLLAQLLEKRAAQKRAHPASCPQEGLWFLHQLEPASPAYNIPMALQLEGRLRWEVFTECLQEIVRRHWTLRTSLKAASPAWAASAAPAADAAVIQRISPFQAFAVPLLDLAGLPERERDRELRRRLGEEVARPFDLTRAPLFRVGILRLAPREHVFYLVVHHAVFDGWSMGVLIREFVALYSARSTGDPTPLPELPIQYVDFARWQRAQLEKGALAGQLDYWRGQLGERPVPLDLPTDRPRPAHWSFRGEACALELPPDLSAGLAELGRRAGASLFITLLAGAYALLSRYTGQSDLSIGSPIANRNRSEVEGLIGFFANTLVFRLRANAEAGFEALLGGARQVAFEAYAHQDLPFERLVQELRPERDLSRSPLFQVMVILQNAPLPPIALPELALRVLDLERKTARFDLLFELWETPGGLRGVLEYSTDLFDAPTPLRLSRGLRTLLAGVVAEPGRPLLAIPLLEPGERAQLLADWNDTARAYPPGLCLHQLFEAQVDRSPEAAAAIAVRCEGRSLSYRDLELASNRLARWLRRNGVGPEDVVGVLLDRSIEMVVALYGVLKAGGAYLPLDPSYPKDRLGFFVADARPRLVLTTSGLADLLPPESRAVLLDTGWEAIAAANGERPEPPDPRAGPDHLAYVIYTSGSTGRPKGAMNAHRGIVNRILWMQEAYGLGAADRVLQKTPFSFDVSVWEFFWPLAVGARLVLARPGGHRDPAYLNAVIEEEGITTLHFVPSMLRAFLDAENPAKNPGVAEPCSSVRRVMASGEELPAEVVARFFARLPEAELHNLYGPTEAAVDVTFWACRKDDVGVRVPIGRPIANLRIHLLDPHGEPALFGVPGELLIGGIGVGRGYLGRPALTAERFVPDPWSPEPGGRLYRTGDLARFRPDAAIDFLGRIDHQVKIRGFRIELGEIEHALRALPEVRDAVVAVRGKGADPRLVAYLMTASGGLAVARWREALREQLPEFMVPAAWVALPALPLLASGKVDRKALPEPAGPGTGTELVAPRTYLEEIVAGIWSQVLGLAHLGVEENVFDLGAHSLLSTQVVSRVSRELGIELPLRRIFELPTVALLAAEIGELRLTAAEGQIPPILPVLREGLLPLSFSQQRLWFFARFEPDSAVFNMPTALRLEGDLSLPALGRSLDEIVRRHEVLRTRFLDIGGEPAQVIDPFRPGFPPLVDLAALAPELSRRETERLAREEAVRPFDLERQGLLRAMFLRTSPGEHTALLTLHHIAADGWSLRILTEEISRAYGALAAGLPSPLPELALQFVDYAAWQRNWLEGEVLARELAFWREQLAEAPETIDLPLDRPRGPVQRYRGRRRSIALSGELTAALRGLGREASGTLFMVLVTATQALLARYANQSDLVVGTLIANRHRREVESLIGFFVNTLVLRTRLAAEVTFRAALSRLRETTLDVYAHQDLPFEKLVEELNPERHLGVTPLFQVLLVLQNAPPAVLDLPGLRLEALEVERGTVNYDLYFTFHESVDGIRVQLDYDTDLFDDSTIRRLLAHLERLAEAMAADPERPLHEVDLLSAAERHQLGIEWGSGEEPRYVLDPRLQPVPIGVSGELCVGEDRRRTGERARFLPDGRLEQLGRLADPIGVIGAIGGRGWRFATGEIGALLGEHPEVGEAFVVARRAGTVRLVAYVTPAAGSSENERAERLRAFLAERLADALVPSSFVFLDRLPRTADGQVDRLALPVSVGGIGGANDAPSTPPRTRTEKALAEIWREVLGAERIGIEDSFFALGGHSLLATRVLSLLRAALGVDLPLRDLFEAPDLAALAARIDASANALGDVSAVPILPAPADEVGRLSFAQERLWFLDQLDPGSPAYNLPVAVLLEGEVAPPVLASILNEIVARHAALRTTFSAVAGRPCQRVHPHRAIELPEVDLGALPAAAAEAETIRWARLDARRVFDLERGPLVRVTLLRRRRVEQVLLLNMHHIVSDGWSMGVFLSEVGALYPAVVAGRPSPLAALPLQYPDYAHWQRQLLQGEILRQQLDYWRQQLAGAPEALDLAGRGARPAVLSASRGRTWGFRLSGALAEPLRGLSRRQGTTLFMTLLAGFAAVLNRYTGAADLMIGVPVAGRGRHELEALIGFFVNTLVARVSLESGAGAVDTADLLRHVRRVTLDAFTHQDLPFEKLVAELNPDRDLDRSPLFQVMFALQNAMGAPIELPGLRLRRLEIETGTTRFELFFELAEAGAEIEGAVHFSRDLFDLPFIARFAEHFKILLGGMAAGPTHAVSSLGLLSAAEQAQLVREWNDSAGPVPADLPFHALFADRAARAPDRIAARAEGRHLTYAALDARADAIALHLIDRGVAEEGIVALLAERDLDFLAAVLGIFKAGAAYLPLDPHHPPARLRQILAQSRAGQVLATPDLAPIAREAIEGIAGIAGEPVPELVELTPRLSTSPLSKPLPARGGAEHLAYVIFTSGSTGVPKGAMLLHRGMINHLFAKIAELGLTAADAVAQTASQCFDISVWQFLAPLVVGGRVEIYADPVAHDPAVLLHRLEADAVTVLETVPSLLRLMLQEIERRGAAAPTLASLAWLIPTGEALPVDLCREWYRAYPRATLLNAYGPTECSDDVSHHRVTPAEASRARSVPIGRPVLNTRLHVMDRALRPVPPGVVGELFVGGCGVGRGYLLDPVRTAAVFVPDPCSEWPGARLYRTGDLACQRDDGDLEFLGRLDHQVKIRGFRLELGEIEAALMEHPALAGAVVLARPEASGAQRLVAYVVARSPEAPTPQELRELLTSHLPEYAIPSVWVTLEKFPLTPNGKIDRRALPEVEPGTAGIATTDRPYVEPRSEVEATVAEIFAALLGQERVGVFDNFFDLGGHSLLATQAIWRLRESFGVDLALRALFEAPTVAELAGVIEDRIIEQIESLSDDEVDSILGPGVDPLGESQDEARSAGG